MQTFEMQTTNTKLSSWPLAIMLIAGLLAAFGIALASAPATATPERIAEFEDDGTLNPVELSFQYYVERIEKGNLSDPMAALVGYELVKSGDHERARKVFLPFAENGNPQAMTWMSFLEDNGNGGEANYEAAAEWDRRAMEAGDSVGTLNWGLDLLRGRGVERDVVEGRKMIDKAARMGDSSAIILVKNGYNLDAVTPDADNWKYKPEAF